MQGRVELAVTAYYLEQNRIKARCLLLQSSNEGSFVRSCKTVGQAGWNISDTGTLSAIELWDGLGLVNFFDVTATASYGSQRMHQKNFKLIFREPGCFLENLELSL